MAATPRRKSGVCCKLDTGSNRDMTRLAPAAKEILVTRGESGSMEPEAHADTGILTCDTMPAPQPSNKLFGACSPTDIATARTHA